MTTQDKLAEALLARIQKAWEAHFEDGKVSISMRDAMELCEQVLPTVIQQAQPPVASVPDAMPEISVNSDEVEWGELQSLEDARWNQGWNACRKAMLAAQENPNG